MYGILFVFSLLRENYIVKHLVSQAIRSESTKYQVGFYHVPDRSFGSVSIMTLGPLPVVPIGSLNVVSSA